MDDDDVTLLGVFYNPSAAPLITPAPGVAASGGVAAVPEPASLALVGVMSLALGAIAVVRVRYVALLSPATAAKSRR
ncbi:MAG: hypothetical protein WD894_21895 [Pirellulales bacterium]